MYQLRQEYRKALRQTTKLILWCAGDCVPDIRNKIFSQTIKYLSLPILVFQFFMIFVHTWGFCYYYCCHELADSAILLRLAFPIIFNINAFLYQIFFLFNNMKVKNMLNELDKIIKCSPSKKCIYKALSVTAFLLVLSLACLLFSYISSCAIRTHYLIIYGRPYKPCDMIYIIPGTPPMDKILFKKPYSKLYIQATSMFFSLLGITFTEFWMANIFRILATTFEESHESLIFLLQEREWMKAKKAKLNFAVVKKLTKESDIDTRFLIWKKHHSKLRFVVKRVDSVLSPIALIHTFFTPILLCLAGFQLLQKNQEDFMKFLDVKSVSYYLVVHCLFRLWTVCDAGENLASQTIGLPSKLVKAQIFGLSPAIQFQIRLLVSINPPVATACQFFSLTRPFLLTVVGTTFTCLVVFLQVKTDPNKFASFHNKTIISGC